MSLLNLHLILWRYPRFSLINVTVFVLSGWYHKMCSQHRPKLPFSLAGFSSLHLRSLSESCVLLPAEGEMRGGAGQARWRTTSPFPSLVKRTVSHRFWPITALSVYIVYTCRKFALCLWLVLWYPPLQKTITDPLPQCLSRASVLRLHSVLVPVGSSTSLRLTNDGLVVFLS